jgi:hypothetical protein
MKKLIIFALGAAAAGACILYVGMIPFAAISSAQPGDKGLFTVAGRTRCVPANKASNSRPAEKWLKIA